MHSYEPNEPYRGVNRHGIVESARPAIRQLRYPGALCIPLTQGQYAIVDESDYWREDVAPYLWLAKWDPTSQTYYVNRTVYSLGYKKLSLHTVITGFAQTDHQNHNGLDNRRINLRDVSGSQNNANTRQRSDNSTGHVGIHQEKRRPQRQWYTYIGWKRDQRSLGYFDSYYDAVAARHKAQLRLAPEHFYCCEEYEIMKKHWRTEH